MKMKQLNSYKHFCLMMALILSVLLLPQANLLGQCGSAFMQTKTGTATRSKVGQMCLSGDSCPAGPPEYYLTYTTTKFWTNSAGAGCTCTNSTTTWSYGSSCVIQYTLPNSDPTNDGCPTVGLSTNTFSGNYNWSTVGDCSGGRSVYYDASLGGWLDQDTNSACDPWGDWDGYCGDGYGISWYSDWVVTNSGCDYRLTVLTGTNAIGSGSVTETLTNLYTTATLESTVDGYAKARMATNNFTDGDAVAANTLDSEESCASATRSKWRIRITGTDPKISYDITFVVVTQPTIGPPKRTSFTIRKKAPNQDPWYVPSEAGADVDVPQWPKGCPQNGGTESVTYTSASAVPSSTN